MEQATSGVRTARGFAAVWMFGMFVGLIVAFIVAFLGDHLPRAAGSLGPTVKPGQLPGRFARWALAGDWRVWLAVCWTVVVAGVLIIWEVYVALSPDDGWVSNGALEWISAFGAVVVWMLGLFGVVLISIAAFLVRRTRERVARAQQGRVDSPDWR